MHINRILNITAHLFASRETASRFSDFWDLFDLYGTLMGGLDKVFAEPHWRKDILPAMSTLPGTLPPCSPSTPPTCAANRSPK